MQELLDMIEQADDCTMTRIIQKVIGRYGKVFPDQEVVFISLPTEAGEERQRILHDALKMLGMDGE